MLSQDVKVTMNLGLRGGLGCEGEKEWGFL